ncbi:hypothetical protein L249_5340 [Ophiocordyceps polyrhachis-furcata BCC 54312]|uniref:GPI ethanolamine phosphate transferase 2 n=1 Tax=Ophiocordyceps polyrhachis-furcata BCC 54312 TaxID=1330021 RepID=A0A367L962_9HYPO|nr:hypothetical protein L249_5340 [Ophiocordyceps polyrhachis-furcata BCC 54312]
MAKSSRASVKKENNRRKAVSIYGPAELARNERLSTKLLEVARQPKPEPSTDVVMETESKHDEDAMESDNIETDNKVEDGETAMDVDIKEPLIRDGAAIPFTANARTPTVTMPRLKAITTGSIPSFVDLILNLDEADTSSSLAQQDSWLAQLKAAGKGKLLMYGDDTWLKLFPETFDRHDGTSSFFDFTEVDHNVTRNVPMELDRSDWALMVLHYLGLDHIGHKAGPRSFNMVPKQREMDGIVKTIFKSIESNDHLQSTLLVLCGDHGMNDAGNHGASSAGETSPALLFLSPKLRAISRGLPAPTQPRTEFDYYAAVEQSDIAPTLAGLLGLPVSKNSLGAFIPDFLPFWPSSSDKVQILIRNAKQILGIVTAAFEPYLFDPRSTADPCHMDATDVNVLACDWRRISRQSVSMASSAKIDPAWLSDTATWLRKAQDLMSNMATKYDVTKLTVGYVTAMVALTMACLAALAQSTSADGNSLPLVIVTLSYGVMMFASSYVEEEHHFWYWSCSLWIAWLGLRSIRRARGLRPAFYHLLTLGCLRLARSWNQTGQKFAGEPDVVKMFLVPNPQLTWALVTLSYAVVAFQIIGNLYGFPLALRLSLTSVLVSAAFSFKLAFTAHDAPELVTGLASRVNEALQGPSLILRFRTLFFFLALFTVLAVVRRNHGGRFVQPSARLLHNLYTLFAMTQSRALNIPLLVLASVVCRCLEMDDLSVADVTTSCLLLQHVFFFAFGGSNSISSVDLSSAYNGVSNFNPVAVGLLTFVSNWAASIFWTSAANLVLLQRHGRGRNDNYFNHIMLLTLFATVSMAFVMAACTALRTHLFIWTVFSPKYLYCMAWTFGQHMSVNVAIGALLHRFGAA